MVASIFLGFYVKDPERKVVVAATNIIMKKQIPIGLTESQWDAITADLRDRPDTVNDYRKVLNLLQKWNGEHSCITTMTPEDAQEYYSYLDARAERGELSARTVHRYKATLRSLGTKMEDLPDVFPGYVNPFRGLLKSDHRIVTVYDRKSFPAPEDIKELLSRSEELESMENLIISMMAQIGLTPAQIEHIKVSDFFYNGNNELCLKFDAGSVSERTKLAWHKSPYYASGMPLKFSKRTSQGDIAWRYIATYVFTPEFTELILKYNHLTGISRDSRNYFLTTRHNPYSYRVAHHDLAEACNTLNIEDSSITPKGISLYGQARNYICYALDIPVPQTIGTFAYDYPLPLKKKGELMVEHMGLEELKETVNLS